MRPHPRTGYQLAQDMKTAQLRAELAKPKRAHPEEDLQIAVIDLLRRFAKPGVIYFHCANGGYRNPREAARFKAMGVLPGVSDIIISMPGGKMGFLELKAGKGKITKAQNNFLNAVATNGHWAICCMDMSSVAYALWTWGALKQRVVF